MFFQVIIMMKILEKNMSLFNFLTSFCETHLPFVSAASCYVAQNGFYLNLSFLFVCSVAYQN